MLLVLALVLPTFAQDVQGDVYVEASVSKTDPYVGEQIAYKFVLYDAVGLTNPLYQPSDFEGFWRIDTGVISQPTAQINGRQYTVTTIATALYAAQSGDVTIKPSSVVLPETVFRPKTTLTANPIGINVQALPEGKPADFDGAVGQFNVAASLDRQSSNVGEPITLVLTITGTGNVEQLAPPSVPQNWRTTVTAGAYSSEIQNDMVVGKRDYQIVFFPTRAGEQELPSIALEYFDPDAAAYRSVSTAPVKIDVTGDGGDSTSAQPIEPSLKLKPVTDLTSSENSLPTGLFVVLFLVPFIGVWFTFGFRRIKTYYGQQEVVRLQRQALSSAIQQINTVSFADTRSGHEQLNTILRRYVADKLNLNTSKPDVRSIMTGQKIPKSTSEKVNLLLEKVDAGLFAPSGQAFSSAYCNEIIELLTDIDREWVTK
jgi:hypothetical protein